MDIDRLLNFASNAGKIMLQSGGEIYRVEETISMICEAFNIEEANVFASPTVVIVSIFIDGKIHTAVKRISTRGVNLNKVHEINSLSREIYQNKPSLDYCEDKLKEIDIDDSYPAIKSLFFAGISTSTFTILFGGGFNDFICAFFTGILVKFISIILNKTNLNDFFVNCLCGTFITIGAMVFLKLHMISEIDKLIAGSIMLLVPGLLLTNSLRDILEGQLVSGLTKAGEALFIGVSTAAGTFFALHIFMLLLGGV